MMRSLLPLLPLFCGLVLMWAACTEETTTVIVPGPPLPDELAGSYLVTWPGGVLSHATITADTVAFDFFPCSDQGGQPTIGGTFEYDAGDGHFLAELKTLRGDTKLVIEGAFNHALEMGGGYQVHFLAQLCEEGSIRMTHLAALKGRKPNDPTDYRTLAPDRTSPR